MMLQSLPFAVATLVLLSVHTYTADAFKTINFKAPTKIFKTPLSSSVLSSPTTPRKDPILGNFDYRTDSKLPWVPTGYKKWQFQGHEVNYIDVGNDGDKKKPPLLLIHGFGASIYHWRYNIPVLARDYHVYAIDLLGFGLSDKPIIDYSAELWRDQALAFIKEVVRK
jgi:Alpha/beta hydrolase family